MHAPHRTPNQNEAPQAASNLSQTTTSMAEPQAPAGPAKPAAVWTALGLLLLVAGPVFVAVVLYQPPGFHPAPFPGGISFAASVPVPERHGGVLGASERVGEGLLPGPEDLAYDAVAGVLYTGCHDGWIRRVRLVGEAPAVEDWVHVGGRPLGLAFGPDGDLVVAEAHQGLVMVKADGTVKLLTNQAEGLQFGTTDGVDVASNGIIYFTDASYKYSLDMHMLDILEGRPHGRLMSFDPSTNQTVVLVRDLYFANGVSLSHDQSSLIFCETPLRRCRRYHIEGERKGRVDKFIDNMPGFPDNVRYDGEGRYWIGLSAGRTRFWDVLLRYPFLRRLAVVAARFVTSSQLQRDGGVLGVDLDGQPLSLYSDPGLYLSTGGLKIGKYLYYGALEKAYISRIDLGEGAANPK